MNRCRKAKGEKGKSGKFNSSQDPACRTWPISIHAKGNRIFGARTASCRRTHTTMRPLPGHEVRREPCNALHTAILSGTTPRAHLLVARGLININETCPKGSTPLILAEWKCQSWHIDALSKRGADVAVTNDSSLNALQASAMQVEPIPVICWWQPVQTLICVWNQ